MPKSTANDLIHTNAEYEKLKKGRVDSDSTPRETPGGQGPGRRGYDKALFDAWTTDELRAQAARLMIDGADSMDRASLMEQLEQRDATLDRTNRT